MKKFIALLLVVLLIFSLVACGNSEKEEQPSNSETENQPDNSETEDQSDNSEAEKPENTRPFIAGTADFSGDFHQGWTNSSYDVNIRRLVWGFGLMTNTPQGEIVDSPLVESKTISDDLTEWTFKLKDGVKFHNGEELTASDVKFTYEFYMDKEALAATGGTSSMSDYIDAITVDEEANIVTFKMKKVIYTTDATVFHETWILAEDTIEDGATAAGQTVQEYVKANISNPIGYGPYKFVEYKESEYVRLVVNPDYIGKAPAIKEIIVRYTPAETELDQLLLGEVDLLPQQVEAEKIDPVKADDNFSTNNYFRHGGGTMVLHTDFEAFQLTEVRQGFAYAFNRPKLIELYMGEYGIASQGPYSKNHWMMFDDDEEDLIGTAAVSRFESSLTDYDILDAQGDFDEDVNIAKTHELFDAAVARTDGEYANFTGDADSGYKWKGEPLNIKIAVTSFWTDTYHLVWNDKYVSKLGFDVTIVGLDWPVMYGHWIGDTDEERQYHAYVGGMSYTIKANPKADYASDKILDWGHPSNNGPRFSGGSSLSPQEWDQLLEDIENAHPITGRDEYRENWREFVRVFNKEVPVIPVYSNNYHDLYTSDLENFDTNALWPWTSAILDANWK
ncbi:ABC transporter substrate-binding protein [Sporosalibacterium faouarense]|uniref:ABC transporter substrate-binding protein n=1 Tax=Sporosalibacterium faouarense TaxID=516123 RepID=UPI00141CE9CD|nr:ABC transporter substrate-binding protein [Sporosalibacterium faouarense]MTI47226.1 ABC transporter substrate-binding protein [Bacillota bacterium]